MKLSLKIAVYVFILNTLVVYTQNQNLSNGNVFDGEPYLAVNPNNSDHIIVAWMGWINFTDRIQIRTRTSFDAGITWSVPVNLPHVVSGYTSADPSIDFDASGDIYISYIDFTSAEPPVTGGVYLCKSLDGGLSWDIPTEIINTSFDGTKWPIDRPWLTIDKSSTSTAGTIYVTSMNLNRTNAPFNPYISISIDSGDTFSNKIIDANGWLAGSINPLPMPSPIVNSEGVLFTAYPSFALIQSPFRHTFLAKSEDRGEHFDYNNIITFNPPANTANFPLAKKAHQLFSNPSNPEHLALIYVSAIHGDLDVFLTETLNSGETWSTPLRLNDDPIENNRMQDLIWGDFDNDGDLVVTWRDRRNSDSGAFQTPSEIWGAYRSKDSLKFTQNFQITSKTVGFDPVLERSGNDFMSSEFHDDIIYTAWGDTKDGNLNIWFQSLSVDGDIITTTQLSSETTPISIFPNPTSSILNIKGDNLLNVIIYDLNGKIVASQENNNKAQTMEINIGNYSSGTYLIEVFTTKGIISKKIIKN